MNNENKSGNRARARGREMGAREGQRSDACVMCPGRLIMVLLFKRVKGDMRRKWHFKHLVMVMAPWWLELTYRGTGPRQVKSVINLFQ